MYTSTLTILNSRRYFGCCEAVVGHVDLAMLFLIVSYLQRRYQGRSWYWNNFVLKKASQSEFLEIEAISGFIPVDV